MTPARVLPLQVDNLLEIDEFLILVNVLDLHHDDVGRFVIVRGRV